MYDESDGMLQDERKVVYWYIKAVEWGHLDGQYNLALMYSDGVG